MARKCTHPRWDEARAKAEAKRMKGTVVAKCTHCGFYHLMVRTEKGGLEEAK